MAIGVVLSRYRLGRTLRAEPAAVESMVDNITCATLRFASFAYYTDAEGLVADL